jgi:hypothetical protein
MLVATGCDDGCECCNYPRQAHDWVVDVFVGSIPEPVPAYPFDLEVMVEVRSLENGNPAPDGVVVHLSISPGSFVSGESVLEVSTVSGRATAIVRIPEAGVYELSVRPGSDAQTVRTTFEVGL